MALVGAASRGHPLRGGGWDVLEDGLDGHKLTPIGAVRCRHDCEGGGDAAGCFDSCSGGTRCPRSTYHLVNEYRCSCGVRMRDGCTPELEDGEPVGWDSDIYALHEGFTRHVAWAGPR